MTSKDLLKSVLVFTLLLGGCIGALFYSSQKLHEEQDMRLHRSTQSPNIQFMRSPAIKALTAHTTTDANEQAANMPHQATAVASKNYPQEIAGHVQSHTSTEIVITATSVSSTSHSTQMASMRQQVVTSPLLVSYKRASSTAGNIAATESVSNNEPFANDYPTSTPIARVDGGGDIGDPDEPIEVPIGDGLCCLALLALAYSVYKKHIL